MSSCSGISKIIWINLSLVLVVLTFRFIDYDNIVSSTVAAEILEHTDISTTISNKTRNKHLDRLYPSVPPAFYWYLLLSQATMAQFQNL